MFTGNKASKIATKYNGTVTVHVTKGNKEVPAVSFAPTSFKAFAESKQHITYKKVKKNLVIVIF